MYLHYVNWGQRVQFLLSGSICFRKMIMYSYHELREALTLLKRQQRATPFSHLHGNKTSGEHHDHCSIARTRFAGFCKQRRLTQGRKPQAFSFHFSFSVVFTISNSQSLCFCSVCPWVFIKHLPIILIERAAFLTSISILKTLRQLSSFCNLSRFENRHNCLLVSRQFSWWEQ